MYPYQHIFWDYYNMACAVPCLALFAYRFFYCKIDWDNTIVREKYPSVIHCFNFIDWNYAKNMPLVNVSEEDKEKDKKKKVLKGDVFDHWFRMYLLVGAIFYSYDACAKVY